MLQGERLSEMGWLSRLIGALGVSAALWVAVYWAC